MNKVIILLAVVALAVVGSYVVFAADPMGGGMMGGRMMSNRMQNRSMMMASMRPMMGGGSLVATQDGGVIVLMGNQLLKYDKDLNLIKKTEVQFDWGNWQKMMMQHRNMMMGRQSESK